jgi:hypothetical protein
MPRATRSSFADVKALVNELPFIGTIFLIVVTAVFCCLAVGPSLQLVLTLAGLAVSHFLLKV